VERQHAYELESEVADIQLNGYTKADVSQRLDVRAAGAKVIDTEPSK
jgi:hypothetical protein